MIDLRLVHLLVRAQFPKWKDLPISLLESSGWDNRTFLLGKSMLIRMPSAASYASQVEKEQEWLPKLAPLLPLPIPIPLAQGEPGEGYPWKWSIYRYLKGEAAASTHITDLTNFAKNLAQFLVSLQRIDPTGGPAPGPHSFYRGGVLKIYDAEVRQALALLKGKVDVNAATQVWETALASVWNRPPVWVHGDISAGNLLTQKGRLSAVIDFGQVCVGDPACDLAISWTLFEGKSRDVFRTMLPLDAGTWARARGWTLWKALIIAANLIETNSVQSTQPWVAQPWVAQPWVVIDKVLADS